MIRIFLFAAAIAAAYLLLRPVIYRYRNRRAGKADRIFVDQRLRNEERRPWRKARKEMEASLSIFDKLNRTIFRNSGPTPAAPTGTQNITPVPPVDVDFEDERVPGPAKDRIRRILACLQEVEVAMSRETIPGFSRIDVEQMRNLHLPKLVKSYIDIPAAHRSEIFRKTGKSASFILNESLDKMQAKIDEILRNLAQHDIDAFTQNTQFIGQRYSEEDNPFG